MRSNKCSSCGGPLDTSSHRYCRKCHAANMREWRKNNPLTEEQRLKGIARAYVKTYYKRGKLEETTCVLCGGNYKLQFHHQDYSKPLEVVRLCKNCHRHVHSSNIKFGNENLVKIKVKEVKDTKVERIYKKHIVGKCHKCGGDNPRVGQRYCSKCHASYMASYRKKKEVDVQNVRFKREKETA